MAAVTTPPNFDLIDPPPMTAPIESTFKRLKAHVPNLDDPTKDYKDRANVTVEGTIAAQTTLGWEPNVVISAVSFGPNGVEYHMPCIDIDLECFVYPSRTEGHNHLYINKALTSEQYWKLLDVMAEVGIVELGYAEASKNKGFSALRLPVSKAISNLEDAVKNGQDIFEVDLNG